MWLGGWLQPQLLRSNSSALAFRACSSVVRVGALLAAVIASPTLAYVVVVVDWLSARASAAPSCSTPSTAQARAMIERLMVACCFWQANVIGMVWLLGITSFCVVRIVLLVVCGLRFQASGFGWRWRPTRSYQNSMSPFFPPFFPFIVHLLRGFL